MTAASRHWEQDRDSTVYIGNLDERVSDALVFELFLQSGRIANVHLPKDRVTQTHQGYGFVEFTSEEDAEYSARVMNGVRLFGKPIRVNKASADKTAANGHGGNPNGRGVDVGAELFIGNLDPLVDERILFETFGRFGALVAQPKIARDEANLSKGYGFVSYTDFAASDDAIANMNGQYLMNKEISVQYAYKKDGKGERHGDEAERLLAAQAKQHGVQPTPATIPVVGGPLFPGQPGAGVGGATPSAVGAGPAAAAAAAATPAAATPHLISHHPQQPMTTNGFNAVVPPPPPPPLGVAAVNHHNPLHHHHLNHRASFPVATAAAAASIPPPPSLGVPTTGLPARPPPSQAGYGGPQTFVPGFGTVPVPQLGAATAAPPAHHQLPAGFAPPAGQPTVPATTAPQQHPMPFAPPPGFAGPQTGIAPPPPPLPHSGSGAAQQAPAHVGMPPGFQGFGVRK